MRIFELIEHLQRFDTHDRVAIACGGTRYDVDFVLRNGPTGMVEIKSEELTTDVLEGD